MGQRVDQFSALVEKHPANELFRFSLAQALAAEARHEEAVPHFEFCASSKPDWMMPRILLGKCLMAMGRSAQARPWLEHALDLAVQQHHETPEAELKGLLRDIS